MTSLSPNSFRGNSFRKNASPEPRVGGESARMIAAIIRSAPISVLAGDRVLVQIPAIDDDSPFARAYQRTERQVMLEEASCAEHGSHQTLDSREFQGLVVSELMRLCRNALGQSRLPEALWMGAMDTRLFADARTS